MVEFQDPIFDGVWLHGRLLIGARDGELVVPDKLDAYNAPVIVESLVDCGTRERFSFLVLDPIIHTGPEPTRTLPEGHWYGADLTLEVRSEKQLVEVLPECVEIKLAYLPPFDWPGPVNPSIRFWVRVSPSTPTPDGGTAMDGGAPPPPTDGGT